MKNFTIKELSGIPGSELKDCAEEATCIAIMQSCAVCFEFNGRMLWAASGKPSSKILDEYYGLIKKPKGEDV